MREKLKSPFRKLRQFGWSKQGAKEAQDSTEEGPLPSVAKCMQDAMELRIKYEGLLTNGQIISGAAYDFSRSLQDMASYMVETFGEVIDQEIGNIFSLLAKVQFEMSKLLDLFAAHVSKTIIKPTELLMTKIQQAEIMKDEYDEERKLYVLSRIEKGRTKRGKVNLGHVMDEESVQRKANLLNLYMQSLKRGQSENLVTQAVKYHSAHMHLFSKGFASVNAVEPMIRQVALDRIIDTTLSEEIVFVDGLMYASEIDLKEKVQSNEFESDSAVSSPRNPLGEQTEPPNYLSDSSEEFYPRRSAVTSKSAPISPLMYHRREAKNLQESALDNESVTMYALPSPLNESGGHIGNKTSKKFERHSDLLHKRLENFAGDILEASKVTHKSDMSVNQHSPQKGQLVHGWQQDRSDSKVSPNNKLSFFVDGTHDDDMKKPIVEKSRRYTQSGPLVDRPSYNKPRYANVRSPVPLYEEYTPMLYKSGPISRSPLLSYTTCNLSPPPSSMPSISELHKLPLPPPGYTTPPKSPSHASSPITHSAPLGKWKQEGLYKSGQVSPLPSPALMTRSLSIPTPTTQLQDPKTES